MALQESKFRTEEVIGLSGKTMAVSGKWQYTTAEGALRTRYLLTEGPGSTALLEERGTFFAMLRPFPPAAAPEASGNVVSVMGEKFTLQEVDKLTLTGYAGKVDQGVRESATLLSGRFQGASSVLLRELVPGKAEQQFYSVRPVAAHELLTAAQLAAVEAAQRELAAQAEPEPKKSGWLRKVIIFGVVILVLGGLLSMCSSDDDDSSGSARVSGGYHGK